MTVHRFPSATAQQIDAATSAGSGFEVIDRLSAYWDSLPREGAAPRRAQIDASALGDLLPHAFLAELVTPRVARLRIVGHQIESLQGLDLRGMPLTCLFSGAARQEVMAALDHVSRGARAMLSITSEGGFARPPVKGVLMLLPLKGHSGRISNVLGALAHDGAEGGRATRRFALAKPMLPAMRALPADIARPAGPAAERPALRVITGGKG